MHIKVNLRFRDFFNFTTLFPVDINANQSRNGTIVLLNRSDALRQQTLETLRNEDGDADDDGKEQ